MFVIQQLPLILLSVILLWRLFLVGSFGEPQSDCYVLDKNDHIYDFTNFSGEIFEYEGKESYLVIRFCKDVQDRSNKGYIDYGRFAPVNYFSTGDRNTDFVQKYFFGDLQNCEDYGFDKMGRTAKVNINCGNCSNGLVCKDTSGCICNVSYHGNCRVSVDLSIFCGHAGPRIFRGFTVGFHPRTWELVYNGITQWGYETAQRTYGFMTEVSKVSLYFTAISSLSGHVGKPFYTVHPHGLKVSLSGSAALGKPPTTLSPTILDVNWQCVKAQESMYVVNITIPIEGYDPVSFYLGKFCNYKQKKTSDKLKGWATFGIFCCIFLVLSTGACCAAFLYRTRVQHQHGIFALPGMTVLDACLEVASGSNDGYGQVHGTSQATWEEHGTSNSSPTVLDRKYGTM